MYSFKDYILGTLLHHKAGALQDMISEKVMTDLNVLCLRVLNWVVGDLDGAFVIAVKWHLLQMNAIVLECLLHPQKLSATRSNSNVFRFSSGERYTVLLL